MTEPGGDRRHAVAVPWGMRWLVVVGLLALLLPAPARADGLEAYRTQDLAWAACGSGTWCTRVAVPLKYSDPGGAQITLALRAVGPRAPDGTRPALLVNPGGPGSSATEYVPSFAGQLSRPVRDLYDVVGVDPRGVEDSTAVTCLTGRQTTRWLRTDPSPDTPSETATLLRRARDIGPGCLRLSPTVARHVGSAETVQDMDIVRSVLGQNLLHWFGFSYGTQLGARYAESFPSRVGRMVLDGAVDPSLDAMQLSRGQSQGFQTAITRFADDCSRRPTCTIGSTTQQVIDRINALLARVDRTPLPTGRDAPLVQAEAITALFFSMYSIDLWPLLEDALAAADRGDGAGLAQLAALATDQIGPNAYGSNATSAFLAIGCWDYPAPPGRNGLAEAARQWSRDAVVPDLARAMSWGNAPCSTWFGHAADAPAPVTSTTTAGILVLGTRFDPATPYAWARNLSAQLPTSRLLTYVGDGHTAYGEESECVQRIVDTYLVSGALPEPGARC